MANQIIEKPSPNHDSRGDQSIDILVLHYTGMRSGAEALQRLCDPAAKVSAHYLIEEDGRLFQLVDEDRRAWHAGVSHWAGATNINARSIGIELVNPGHEFGYRPFPAPQMAALAELSKDLIARHTIPAARVLGHSDVAPARKEDPGELFDWTGLAVEGIGLWPKDPLPERATPSAEELSSQLRRFGYGTDELEFATVVKAFQRHFQQDKVTGQPDGRTLALIEALLVASEGRARGNENT